MRGKVVRRESALVRFKQQVITLNSYKHKTDFQIIISPGNTQTTLDPTEQ